MKHKGEDLFFLLAVIICVLGSALLLRTAFDSSLESYTNEVQTNAQAERIRTPLQELDADESSIASEMESEKGTTPKPAYPKIGAGEADSYGASAIYDSPMSDETYLAGFNFSQEADMMAMEICRHRYGGDPIFVKKAYMESPDSFMGYAWYGVVQIDGDIPVIFHYVGSTEDIWTERTDNPAAYYFFDDQTEESKTELQTFILTRLKELQATGEMDWYVYE